MSPDVLTILIYFSTSVSPKGTTMHVLIITLVPCKTMPSVFSNITWLGLQGWYVLSYWASFSSQGCFCQLDSQLPYSFTMALTLFESVDLQVPIPCKSFWDYLSFKLMVVLISRGFFVMLHIVHLKLSTSLRHRWISYALHALCSYLSSEIFWHSLGRISTS